MSIFQAIILGILQGIAELFPISSLGQSVILPRILGWTINSRDNTFLIFLVGTHFATATVLFLFFRKDWFKIIRAVLTSIKEREIKGNEARLGWLLIVATIPAGILGLLFEDQIRSIFISAQSAAFFLILNGFLLLGAEYLRRKSLSRQKIQNLNAISNLSWNRGTFIGTAQAFALVPGFSRTGASMAGGLLSGLSHEDAARFSFLLATPIIGAAAVLKLPELLSPDNRGILMPTFVGAVFAGIFAYLSVKFLTKYFQTEKLTPFAYYCLIVGVTASLWFWLAG